MTPEEIAQVLVDREWDWEPTIVSQQDVDDLLDVESGHLMKCVDGRPSDNVGMAGPKSLGGVYAIASLREVTEAADLQAIVKEVLAAGYIPSVHGDEGSKAPPPMGCGYFKLWKEGRLTGLPQPQFSAGDGAKVIIEAGGAYERLEGKHTETEVVINLVKDKTLAPSTPQRFVVDAWVTEKFKLNVGRYLVLAAQTVELLTAEKPVTKVRIIH